MKKYYRKLHSSGEGEAFFSIMLDMKRKHATLDTAAAVTTPNSQLKAVS